MCYHVHICPAPLARCSCCSGGRDIVVLLYCLDVVQSALEQQELIGALGPFPNVHDGQQRRGWG